MVFRHFKSLGGIYAVFAIFLTQLAFSQTPVINQNKYWEYRERLKKDFLWIGEGQGKSVPANFILASQGSLIWEDATINHGWYLGILATEYHLSIKKGYVETGESGEIDPKETLVELYYALKALERLDYQAEVFFEAKAELNGFFIRDDVDNSLLEHFENVTHIVSDYTGENKLENEMSREQCIHLLMGLVLVKHFIPEATQVKGEFINALAEKLGLLIIDHMSQHTWRISNPARIDNKGHPIWVNQGYRVMAFGKGLNAVQNKLSSDENLTARKVNLLNNIFWGTLRSGLNPFYLSCDKSSMAQMIMATGNGFNKVTYRKLVKRSNKNNWYVYPLLNKVLYPRNKNSNKEILFDTEALLHVAPQNGPHSSCPESNSHGWATSNRFLENTAVQYHGNISSEGRIYNGLDVMLLYNLYRIIKTESYKDAWKLLDMDKNKKDK